MPADSSDARKAEAGECGPYRRLDLEIGRHVRVKSDRLATRGDDLAHGLAGARQAQVNGRDPSAFARETKSGSTTQPGAGQPKSTITVERVEKTLRALRRSPQKAGTCAVREWHLRDPHALSPIVIDQVSGSGSVWGLRGRAR